MKASRDHGHARNPQNSPIGPSKDMSFGPKALEGGSSYEGAQRGGGTKKTSSEDAVNYVKTVKEALVEQPKKYNMFLKVMGKFKGQRIERNEVIEKVKEMFEGHPDLIMGFNVFLPKGQEITITHKENKPPKEPVEFEDCVNFIEKIQERFGVGGDVFNSFLDMLRLYQNNKMSVAEVYQHVVLLFKEHPDLVEEFKMFMPAYAIPTSN